MSAQKYRFEAVVRGELFFELITDDLEHCHRLVETYNLYFKMSEIPSDFFYLSIIDLSTGETV